MATCCPSVLKTALRADVDSSARGPSRKTEKLVGNFSSVPSSFLIRRVVARTTALHRRRKEEERIVANGLPDLNQSFPLEFWPGWNCKEGELFRNWFFQAKPLFLSRTMWPRK